MNALVSMREQIERQAETIRLLRAAIDPDKRLPSEWNLTRREGEIFVLLLRRERQTPETLHGALYTACGIDHVAPSVIHSHVCKMRRKLRPFGVDVEWTRHQGYRIPDRSRFVHLLGAAA